MFKRFFKEESGQGMVEYGLIIALVAIALIVVIGLMTGGLQSIFTQIATALST
jgi:pilus assembly protein Flp/PilA